MKQMARKVGVARSTMYTHHHTVKEFLADWEGYILKEYNIYIKKRVQVKNKKMRILYFDTLIFILKNQKFFEVFLKYGNREVLIKMFFSLWTNKKTEGVYRICASEITEVIFEWGKIGFPEQEIEKVFYNITYLADTMWERIGPLYK